MATQSPASIVVLSILGALFLLVLFFWIRYEQTLKTRTTRTSHDNAHSSSASERDTASETDLSAVAGLLLLAGASFVVFKLAQKGFSFLKELDLKELDSSSGEALTRFSQGIEKINNSNARLERAEELLSTDDKIALEEAALLASATMEEGLKLLCEQHSVILPPEESEGMVSIANALKDRQIISPHECAEVKKYAYKIRNKVMHGDFDDIAREEIQAQIAFVRSFFAAYSLV